VISEPSKVNVTMDDELDSCATYPVEYIVGAVLELDVMILIVPWATDPVIVTGVRELEEELGLKASPKDMQLLFTLKREAILNEGKYIDREHVDIYLVEMELKLSDLVLQESEVSDAKFIHFEDLAQALRRGDEDIIPTDPDDDNGYGRFFKIIREKYRRVATD